MMKTTAREERPRERCLREGTHGLSLRECLALILGSGPPGVGCMGLAERILSRTSPEHWSDPDRARALFSSLETSEKDALAPIHGLGAAGVCRLLAAFELGRRYASMRQPHGPASENQTLRSKTDPLHLALEKIPPSLRTHPQEWLGFVAVLYNGQMTQLCRVEKGARTHVNVDPAELFARLLALRPRGFFLFHNHPSGNPRPSSADRQLTRQVSDLAEVFGITLLGHWVVTGDQEKEA